MNLYIILFDNHVPLKKISFCHSKYILVDVLDNYVQKYENIKKKCIYSFLPFNFVIWQVACEYSLKHISLTYFRSNP